MKPMMGVVRVGKERLAAGLFWQPAPTAALAVREARIVAAKAELATDLFCVRRRGVPQFGLAQRKVGHRPGMRAIAAILANSIDAMSWLGAFRVEAGWLIVMVRKGAVMPDGDLVVEDENDGRQRLLDELASDDWAAVFAPAEWQIAGSRSEDLANLVSLSTDARLRPVIHNPATTLLWIGGTAAAGIVLWSLMVPSSPPAPAVPIVPVAPPPPPPPWHGQPNALSLIRACQRAIESTATIAGYEVEGVSCGSGGTTVRYHRRWGRLSWLPEGSLVTSPDRATIAEPLPVRVDERTGEERPWPANLLRRVIWGAAQTYQLDSEINEPPSPGLPGRESRQPADFRAITIAIGSALPPSAIGRILGTIPTLVVEEVSWQPLAWRVKGKVYVR